MKLLTAVFLFLGLQSTSSAVDPIVVRASRYVDGYMKELAAIIGEEQYVQEALWEDRQGRGRRRLKSHRGRRMVSDFLTVPVGGEYVGMRHVREVDDVPLDPQYRGFWREAFD